ncbi:(Na+)-NQR maturation NqrM [Wenzhouxiangella sp. XN24]|uniref:(Na+)-NQR maturation NqrM n=1 Tax=Wenzhouxiangella sp. XN24 TaxID=2713569 RepID=UPI0013ECC28E|nr:(Na+)-NQR maturation NqrM [Wenzhouxiangella sp. XN24]NGX16630.1 (Na+)-NQR maturation NqrM [Wenzhouxiangella sp. XN24]
MAVFVLSFLIFATAIGAMAIGVMCGRPRIEGSCGGLNRVAGVDSDCGGACRRPCARRRAAN